MLSVEKTRKGREPPIAERPTRRGAGETIRRGQNRSSLPLILSVAPVFGLCLSRHLCALVILFASATLPAPYLTLMNAPRPAALLFLRSLILAVAWGGAVVSVQAAPVVSNLTAAQRAGTKLVDISYDLAAPGFGSVTVSIEASSDGGATWTVPVTSATGAVGGIVTPGTGRDFRQ